MNIKSSTMYMQMLCLGLSIDTPPPPHILHVSIDLHFFVNRAIGIRHTRAHYFSSHFDLHLCHTRPHTLNKCISHTQPRRALHDKPSISLSLSLSLSRHIRCLCKTPSPCAHTQSLSRRLSR